VRETGRAFDRTFPVVRVLTTRVVAVAPWLVHQRVRATLERILPILASAGIPCLIVKGATLVGQLARDPATRPLADIDVRVKPSDFETTVGLIANLAETSQRYPPYPNAVFVVRGQAVDLEASIGPPFLTQLSVAELLARHVLVDGVPAPCVTDHALLLAVNYFKDAGNAPSWTLEDTLDIVAHPDFELERFVERSVRAQSRELVRWVASELMDRSQGWAEIFRALGPSKRPLYARALRVTRSLPPGALVRRVLARAGSDAPTDQLRALAIALVWDFRHGRPRRKRTRTRMQS
jgi:hypothetical protein